MEISNNVFVPNILQESIYNQQKLSLSSALFKARKLFLIDDIEADSMGILMQSLMYLDSISDEPIELYINSGGGVVTSGMAVYHYMTSVMRSPIHTFCIGFAASMAAILFLAGSKRYAYEGTKIIIHDPSSVAPKCEKPGELKDRLTSLVKTKDLICHIISDRTGHPFDEISEIIKNDKIYDAEEAVSFGLATNIISREAVDYHNNPFASRPNGGFDTKRGLPAPTERYHMESDVKPSTDNVIIPAVPRSLLHLHKKDGTTVFRFGFSYRFTEDGKTVYANTDIVPAQTRFVNYKYNIDLGAADRTYECELSDGSGTVLLQASEIAKLYMDSRNKYLNNKIRRSALAPQ